MEERDWHSPGNSDSEDEIGNSRYKARAYLKITKQKRLTQSHAYNQHSGRSRGRRIMSLRPIWVREPISENKSELISTIKRVPSKYKETSRIYCSVCTIQTECFLQNYPQKMCVRNPQPVLCCAPVAALTS